MTTARPFSPPRDPFVFEIGWVNALSLVLALCLLLMSAGARHARADTLYEPFAAHLQQKA